MEITFVCKHCGEETVLIPKREIDPKSHEPLLEGLGIQPKTPSVPKGPVPLLQGDPEIEAFLKNVSQAVQERWIKLYKDPSYVRREILKAISWLENNPARRRSHLGRFMTNWLERNPRPFGEFQAHVKAGLELVAGDGNE